jgi:hypothetical protein
MEHLVESQLAGEAEVVGRNLPQCHFVHHKSHLIFFRTRAAAVGSRRLTACTMARPLMCVIENTNQSSTFNLTNLELRIFLDNLFGTQPFQYWIHQTAE